MRKQSMIRKDLPSKKVAVWADDTCKIVAAWLKPGDKLKIDEMDSRDYYLDKFGDIPFRRVWVNGQAGFVTKEALSL